jgi:hypothetical protein
MSESVDIKITGVLLKEASAWVAQGLEYDIAAQGTTIRDAINAFERTVVGQIMLDLKDNKKPLASLPKAPHFYWQKYAQGELLADGRLPFYLPADVPVRSAEAELKVA